MSLLRDLGTLRQAGVLRPLGPKTTIALTRQLAREGLKAHLVYTIHGTQDPDKPALISPDRVTTWAGLLDRTRRLANHFLERGVGPEAGVAVMLPNRPEFIEAHAAGLRSGATVAYINPRAPAADAADLVRRTGARLLVTHRDDVVGDHSVLRIGSELEAAMASARPDEPRVELFEQPLQPPGRFPHEQHRSRYPCGPSIRRSFPPVSSRTSCARTSKREPA